MQKPIYLDYNATTPIDPRVMAAMMPFLTTHFGNPSSAHYYGREPKEAIERARAQVATFIGCLPEEIIFTGGATESNNLAIQGIAYRWRKKGNHIITSQVEHPAVLETCRFLEKNGYEITYVGVDCYGRVHPDDVRKAIRPKTILVTIMHANNEVGTIQPIQEIARIAREHEVWMHTDAAQTVGKIGVHVADLNVDLLSIAGHKFYAPKGIGALYVRKGMNLEPLIHGAGQESGRRAGTENVAFIVGLGSACVMAAEDLGRYGSEIKELRDHLENRLKQVLGERIRINGHPVFRLPNTSHVSFVGIEGSELLIRMPSLAASTGAACHSGQVALSSVLQAMGVSPREGMGAVRFSLGRWTTAEEIDHAITTILDVFSAMHSHG